MNNLNKILIFIVLVLTIVFTSFLTCFILTYSEAKTVYTYNRQANIVEEIKLNEKNEEIIVEVEEESKTQINQTNNVKEENIVTEINNDKYITASMELANEYPEGFIEEFNSKIIDLQKEFPKGYYWNHMGSAVNSNSITKTPCNNWVNGTKYCNEYQGKSTIVCGFKIGRQCAGFASMLSDRIFGKDANARIFYNYDDLKIGDQARIDNNFHTVFIIDKTDEYVIVAECNSDYKTCEINWGRKIYRNQLKGYYIIRR